jgi:hypothetical protein
MEVSNQYFVGWGTLALINAGLAQGKNRGGMNWFLVRKISLDPGRGSRECLRQGCAPLSRLS